MRRIYKIAIANVFNTATLFVACGLVAATTPVAKPQQKESAPIAHTDVAPPVVPAELQEVSAKWYTDGTGRVVGVDLATADAVLGHAVTKVEFSQLKQLTDLRKLVCPGSDVTDEWLPTINAMGRLHELSLGSSSITSRGVNNLPTLTDLRVLDLGNTQIDDEAIDMISTYHKLEELDISDTHISGDGIARLVKLQHLRYLRIGHTYGVPTLNSSLHALFNMRALKKLDILYAGFTADEVRLLRFSHPNCEIISRFKDQ